jgi:hypothetical protein
MTASLLRPDGEVDLAAVADMFDQAFAVEPAERLDPQLFALLGGPGDEETAIAQWPDVDHELLMFHIVPPPDCLVLVLVTTGWAAPLDDDGECSTRPSQHPERRRSHTVTAIGNDGEIVSVLRVADEAPKVLTGECYGRVPDALRSCWKRRARAGAAGSADSRSTRPGPIARQFP